MHKKVKVEHAVGGYSESKASSPPGNVNATLFILPRANHLAPTRVTVSVRNSTSQNWVVTLVDTRTNGAAHARNVTGEVATRVPFWDTPALPVIASHYCGLIQPRDQTSSNVYLVMLIWCVRRIRFDK